MCVSNVMQLPSVAPDVSHVAYLMLFYSPKCCIFHSDKQHRAERE